MLTIILAITIGALIYYYFIKPVSFWAERGITHVPGWPIVGNMGAVLRKKKHMSEIINESYQKHSKERYFGMHFFASPVLLVKDLDLIKQIGIKDFEHFHDHRNMATSQADPLLSKSLISLRGEKWKQMRSTLSPVFTSSKMKNMFILMAECAENFCKQFDGKEKVQVEMKDLFGKFAADVIASTAFGIPLDHTKDPENEFYTMTQKIFKQSPFQVLKLVTIQISSKLAAKLKFTSIPEDAAEFFTSVIRNNIDRRTKDNILRPDLIHLLMEARKGALLHDQEQEEKQEGFATVEESQIGKNPTRMDLTDHHIVAQALLFFLAGYETVSNATSLMAYQLATNPDVQRKLQEEIDSISDGKLTYEALLSMKYLDQVVCETLRLWPPVFRTDRHCNKDFAIEPEKTFVIKKGMLVIVPIMALHRDPKYFPDPDRFDPERFNEENRGNIVPGSYLPFGIGPRNCIGSRFALLEVKILFFYLLRTFSLVPTEKTEIPLKLDPVKFNLVPKNGFQLGLERRK